MQSKLVNPDKLEVLKRKFRSNFARSKNQKLKTTLFSGLKKIEKNFIISYLWISNFLKIGYNNVYPHKDQLNSQFMVYTLIIKISVCLFIRRIYENKYVKALCIFLKIYTFS